MIQFSDFRPVPEFVLYESLVKNNVIVPSKSLANDWNDPKFNLHLAWADFEKALEKYNYNIESNK